MKPANGFHVSFHQKGDSIEFTYMPLWARCLEKTLASHPFLWIGGFGATWRVWNWLLGLAYSTQVVRWQVPVVNGCEAARQLWGSHDCWRPGCNNCIEPAIEESR